MDKNILISKNRLLNFLNIRENYLYGDFLVDKYKLENISKKDGGLREIHKPSFKTKKIQRKILDSILINFKPTNSVFGLSAKKGVLDVAKIHQKNANNYLANLDIKDFFPSINQKMVKRIFIRCGCSKECASILTKICTVDGCLPQGAPTSPYLSALALVDLDKKIYKFCIKNNITYTRYFDDITLSGKNLTKEKIDYVENLIVREGYKIHPNKKDSFLSNQVKIVNSVIINKKSFDVTNEYKKKILESYLEYKTKQDEKSHNRLRGLMAFYVYINRSLAFNFSKRLEDEYGVEEYDRTNENKSKFKNNIK